MSRTAVYFMPGLAANPSIFERIVLSEHDFEVVFLEWENPLEKETLVNYAKRIALKIKHPNPVLIGVSFGGILVQEMAKILPAKKVIIISSVKSKYEFPRRIKIARVTKIYKMIPIHWLSKIENIAKYFYGTNNKQRFEMYDKFLSVRNEYYLSWALEQVILWNRTVVDKNVVHIHGGKDAVFPIKNIQNSIEVKGGTHIMIISKYKWFNENLARIISE